ncbi:MAG: hypothetical protein VX211_01315 [Pseudomonadota bacterium]|nr:hypothetical protein [Pseudomonadota bacterium]
MTTLVATSVVRGSRQGESHGGVYLIDLTNERVLRTVDWDAVDIDWQGRGWDRGLRGIEFDGDRIFIAASDELFVYDPTFRQITSYRCPYLKHCHEISRHERRLYLTSTGFDTILGFDLDRNLFSWGLSVSRDKKGLRAVPFDPESRHGPPLRNELHINSIFCESRAMYISGLRTSGIHAYTGRHINKVATLPDGTHNARPYRNGVLFNDTQKNVVRFVPQKGKQGIFNIPVYNPGLLTHTEFDDSHVARQAFGRGLCVIRDGLIAGGSSPSTVTLYDIDQMKTTQSLNLSIDIRNAIHGLETWPFQDLPDD